MVKVRDVDLRPLVRCCIGRRTDHAVQQEGGLYRRAFASLSPDLLYAHLAGRTTLGTYVTDERGFCRFAVFDDDDETGRYQLLAVRDRLAAAGIPSYPERTRRSLHLWVFLAAPVPAAALRRWLRPYCPPGIEFYPKRDWSTLERPGSLVRVPLGVHRRTGCRYPFVLPLAGELVPVACSVPGVIAWLSTVERAVLPARFLSAPAPEENTRPLSPQKKYPSKTSFSSTGVLPKDIQEWCRWQDPFSLIGRYVSLDASGMGCCPFGDHHSDGVDSHPSFKVYTPTGSHVACWYCLTWQHGGSVFDFLRLYYGLDARELWHRILRGDRF